MFCRAGTKPLSLRSGMDSGELQKGKIYPIQCRDVVNFSGQKTPALAERSTPCEKHSPGQKGRCQVLDGDSSLDEAARSRNAKGANGYDFCQNSFYWKMTRQRQLDQGRAFTETKGSWVPITGLGGQL